MKLHHIAFWTKNVDRLVEFYKTHFNGEVLSQHESGDFRCVFLKIYSSITIEIMTRTNLQESIPGERTGYSHFSIEVSSKDQVNKLTDYFVEQNIPLQKNKEQYDDGFYESAVLDPDGNIIEIAYVDRTVNPNV
jgi:catechol 2,3-dioxygenase-like lactoylglutathione lyase family enzyme